MRASTPASRRGVFEIHDRGNRTNKNKESEETSTLRSGDPVIAGEGPSVNERHAAPDGSAEARLVGEASITLQ
jgi:hypothetical protein